MMNIRRRPHWFLSVVGLALLGSALEVEAQELGLPEAVEAALRTHPSLQAADARIQAAEETRVTVDAGRFPSLSLDAGLTRFAEPMVVAPLHSFDPNSPPGFDRTLVQSQLGLRYLVFDGGGRRSEAEGAEAAAARARYGGEDTRVALIEQTALAYIQVMAARSQRDAANRLVRALEAELARARQNLEVGTAAELEVLRADAASQDARAREFTATTRIGAAERSLSRITGLSAATLSAASFSGSIRSRPNLAGDPTVSLVVLQAERAVEAAQAQLRVERTRLLPQVEAGAGLLDFGTATSDHVFEWQAGLRVTWPVFTGGASRAAIRRAEAGIAIARGELEMARLGAEQTTDAAETAILDAEARAQALAASVTQWEEVARIEALALDAGSGVQSDLLSAQAGLFQARAGLAQAEFDAAAAWVMLARAQGVLDQAWIAQVWENP